MGAIIAVGPLRKSSRKPAREVDDGARLDAAATHYEVLGVSKRADATALQYAWRRAAARWHTDRPDGDEARFKRCELAMAVLSDPARRKHYDESGEDQLPPPVEDDARELLEQVFGEYIDKAGEFDDGVEFVRKSLLSAKSNASAHGASLEKELAKLNKRAKAIRAKPGKTNLYAVFIAKRIDALRGQIHGAHGVKQALRVMTRALELAEDYEDAIERPKPDPESFTSILMDARYANRQGLKPWPWK
jgi:curved DNA-binding protein CbpA